MHNGSQHTIYEKKSLVVKSRLKLTHLNYLWTIDTKGKPTFWCTNYGQSMLLIRSKAIHHLNVQSLRKPNLLNFITRKLHWSKATLKVGAGGSKLLVHFHFPYLVLGGIEPVQGRILCWCIHEGIGLWCFVQTSGQFSRRYILWTQLVPIRHIDYLLGRRSALALAKPWWDQIDLCSLRSPRLSDQTWCVGPTRLLTENHWWVVCAMSMGKLSPGSMLLLLLLAWKKFWHAQLWKFVISQTYAKTESLKLCFGISIRL